MYFLFKGGFSFSVLSILISFNDWVNAGVQSLDAIAMFILLTPKELENLFMYKQLLNQNGLVTKQLRHTGSAEQPAHWSPL